MRKLGKEISKGNGRSFLEQTTDNSYEEKTMRGIVIGLLKTESYEEFLMYCDDFVQRIDSWAVCDGFCANLKQTKKYKSEFFPHVCEYTKSDNPWIIRAGLVLMLDYYLEDEYIDTVLECCDNAKNPHYYVSMARAWLVATIRLGSPHRCHVPVLGFRPHGHDVALFKRYMVAIAEISFAGILELNFYQIAFFSVSGNIGQPVVGVQLFVLPAATFAAETSASVM